LPVLGEGSRLAQPILPKAAVFDAMGYKCFAKEVVDFHNSDARIRIVTAPARAGKSYSTGPEAVFRALPHKPLLSSLQWIVGTDYSTNKEFQYAWKWLVEERERWTMKGREIQITKAQNNPTNGNLVIVIDWGFGEFGRAKAIIEGKSSNVEKSLQGEHVTQWIQSEAADHPEHIWRKYGSTRSRWAIFPTTPKPRAEWLRAMVEQGEKHRHLSTDAFTFPPHANPEYDHELFQIEKQKAQMRSPTGNADDDPYFAEQFLGHWVYYTGRVLPFGAQNCVKLNEKWLDHSKIFVSTDFGYSDACVALFWAVLPSGALLIWDEVYERLMKTHDFVEAISEKLKGREHQVAYVCGDPKQPQVARYMSDYGMNVIDINKKAQADRAVGHRRLVDLLSVDPKRGHPMLFVAEDRCPKTVVEWKHLRYREGMRNEYSDAALEGDDHSYDAARYGVMTRPTPRVQADDRNWVTEALRQRREERRHEAPTRFNRGQPRWNRTIKRQVAV